MKYLGTGTVKRYLLFIIKFRPFLKIINLRGAVQICIFLSCWETFCVAALRLNFHFESSRLHEATAQHGSRYIKHWTTGAYVPLYQVDGEDVMPGVNAVLEHMKGFCSRVIGGEWKGQILETFRYKCWIAEVWIYCWVIRSPFSGGCVFFWRGPDPTLQ